MPTPVIRLQAALILLLLTASYASFAADETVGEVVFVRGVATAQQGDEALRIIGKGDKLLQGDKLDTSEKSFALIKLRDGTKMTLRPETAMVLDKVVTLEGKESGLMSLVKGGLRTVTGFIGKRRPGNFQIRTPTATIGIRGTDFDARLCEDDCNEEVSQQKKAEKKKDQPKQLVTPVAARAAMLRGVVTVKAEGKPDRLLTKGGPVYEGDIVDTAIGAFVVLAFSDQTRLTVQSNSRFKVASYQYSQSKTTTQREDSVGFSLIKGGLRMLTGLVGKRAPNKVRITSPVATIGIRGTGVDAICGAGCADNSQGNLNLDGIPDGLHTAVWDGNAFIEMPSGIYSVQNGEAFFLGKGATAPVKMPVIPIFIEQNPAPRPDGVEVDFEQMFGQVSTDDTQPGLYVTVRDGHVTLEFKGEIMDIAGGESACACLTGPDGQPAKGPVRLPTTPVFIDEDTTPTPWQFDEGAYRVIEMISDEANDLECAL